MKNYHVKILSIFMFALCFTATAQVPPELSGIWCTSTNREEHKLDILDNDFVNITYTNGNVVKVKYFMSGLYFERNGEWDELFLSYNPKTKTLEKSNGGLWEQCIPLGTVWNESENGWSAVWTRRGNSQDFDAVWTLGDKKVTGELIISIDSHRNVMVTRKASDGNNCQYFGILADDGVSISGTYTCSKTSGTYTWTAVISK